MAPGKRQDGKDQQRKKATALESTKNSTTRDVRKDQGEVPSKASLSLQTSQVVLDTFVGAFPNLLRSSNIEQVLLPLLQKIKGHLYNREFDAAFGRREYLEAYTARWSPSRALCYVQAFAESFEILLDQPKTAAHPSDLGAQIQPLSIGRKDDRTSSTCAQVTCLGGSAAELVALATLPLVVPPGSLQQKLEVALIDRADWSGPLEDLYKNMTSPATVPSETTDYGPNAVEQTSALSIQATRLEYTFRKVDLLNLSATENRLFDEKIANSDLITVMFTLNELYSLSVSSTQSMLLNITSMATPGTLLLVVDSAGSYSTVAMNQKEKKYPMQWLLNYTLMTFAPKALSNSGLDETNAGTEKLSSQTQKSSEPSKSEDPLWELVMSTNSKWYRLPEISYPVELEDMRYQQHIYRRL